MLADHPIYHWARRERKETASSRRFDASGYFDNVREVLDLVEAGREPGPERDALMLHWYRGKMLKRVGGRNWLWREEDFRRELFEAVRPLALERFGEEVHERLPFNLRLRSKLLRRGDLRRLGRLSRSSAGSRPWCASAGSSGAARTWCCGWSRGSGAGPEVALRARGKRTFWVPPTDALAPRSPRRTAR